MPTYTYRVLDNLGRKTDELVDLIFPFEDRPDIATLDDGRRAEFDFGATVGSVNTTPPGAWPRLSNALGVNRKQVADFNKKYPHHGYQADGRVKLESPAHARRVLADRGAVDMN